MIVTIDGPTASGKSSVARVVAQELGFYYLPTGWLYRSVAYLLVNQCNYSEDMLPSVTEKDVRSCIDINRLIYTYDKKNGGILYYDGKDITPYLKDYKVDRYVALISPIPTVRTLVTDVQRIFAKTHDSVVEGRDTGSVVFPHADYKFFLTADVKVRAQRWLNDQKKRGNSFSLSEAIEKIESRDIKDRSRKLSPLVIPENAHVINNSDTTEKETVKRIMSFFKH